MNTNSIPLLHSDVFVTNKYKDEKVKINDILLFKGDSNYSYIYTLHKTFLVSKTLKEIELTVQDKTEMIRVHKSFIININFIKTFSDAFGKKIIILQNDLEVDVSRRKWPVLKRLLK